MEDVIEGGFAIARLVLFLLGNHIGRIVIGSILIIAGLIDSIVFTDWIGGAILWGLGLISFLLTIWVYWSDKRVAAGKGKPFKGELKVTSSNSWDHSN